MPNLGQLKATLRVQFLAAIWTLSGKADLVHIQRGLKISAALQTSYFPSVSFSLVFSLAAWGIHACNYD